MFSFAVLGAGRWGSLISWYISKLGYNLVVWGRKGSYHIEDLMKNRCNKFLCFGPEVKISTDINLALKQDYIVISINAQNLRSFLLELKSKNINLKEKKVILCMKGIEETSGMRLTQILEEFFPESKVAIWVGPGHVQSIVNGIPTCMVIDSKIDSLKNELQKILSSDLIKCYKGNDLIGNEIGAACKNVLGIAAGILDAMNMESLKGPLMSIGAHEVSILIEKKGGKKESAYGLCHLGDFQATLFSHESNNRKFGESLVTGEKISFVAEGVGTSNAVHKICNDIKLELPVFSEIYNVIQKIKKPEESIKYLFSK